ncbi:OLC1v1025419C2 [Oldenlandia corymbosa var. corymbosa]|uniref:OLC1v1025419C2 n=1 Tax=Oldenlandia corymbosa var. corymbosa TaxID=529605 RepID=A0AAV1C6F0_OLDCO|nr:OLC1v1025419C2 [Oldenlandia corymbosa var. corymbosa]
MKLLQTVCGGNRSVLRAIGRRYFAVSAEEHAKRNYAYNDSEYNTVINSVTTQRRHYLLRDVYDDMMLDGVKPQRETFHSLVIGSMKGSRIQDALYFRDEMKAMGLVPDVAVFNFLITTCGKCQNADQAARLLEEMKNYEVKPTGQTFVCLLNAFAASGRLDRVLAIVRDMTAAGLGLNRFCYAGLIAAHKNMKPLSSDVASKIIELVEQSKGWASVDQSKAVAENFMKNIFEEELYNIPTADYVRRRGGFLNRFLTVYHAAFHAFADLRNVEAMEILQDMLRKDGQFPDTFIVMQIMRCYLRGGKLDRAVEVFNEYIQPGKPAAVDLYLTLIEGAMIGYTPEGMQIAQDTLAKMNERNFFLSAKSGNDLLLVASGEKTGGFTTANMIWDMMQALKITPSLPAAEAYYNGLKEREIPEDDQRLVLVKETLHNGRGRRV